MQGSIGICVCMSVEGSSYKEVPQIVPQLNESSFRD